MNARLSIYADRADFIRDQALIRSQSPYSSDELAFSMDYVGCGNNTLDRMADALNTKDDAELGRLLRVELEQHRFNFHASELEKECDK